jgi:hypothetical protein
MVRLVRLLRHSVDNSLVFKSNGQINTDIMAHTMIQMSGYAIVNNSQGLDANQIIVICGRPGHLGVTC